MSFLQTAIGNVRVKENTTDLLSELLSTNLHNVDQHVKKNLYEYLHDYDNDINVDNFNEYDGYDRIIFYTDSETIMLANHDRDIFDFIKLPPAVYDNILLLLYNNRVIFEDQFDNKYSSHYKKNTVIGNVLAEKNNGVLLLAKLDNIHHNVITKMNSLLSGIKINDKKINFYDYDQLEFNTNDDEIFLVKEEPDTFDILKLSFELYNNLLLLLYNSNVVLKDVYDNEYSLPRMSLDGSRDININGMKQPIDQNQFCTLYNDETKDVEDPLSIREKIDPRFLIRIVTLVGGNKPIYQCYDVRDLYEWTWRNNNNTDPMTKGIFNNAEMIKIEEKMESVVLN